MGFNKQILDFGRIFGIELFKYKMNKLLIENPPQIHNTIVSSMQGIADRRLIITVAPQYDICPQGNTYPINAAVIDIKRIIILQTLRNLYEQ